MTNNDPTLSRPFLELATIAAEFCKLIENAASTPRPELIRSLAGFVPLLYLRGSLLNADEPEYPEANERYVTEEQWENAFSSLRAIFGELDEFWHIDYTESSHNDPLKASMADCLADVYQDLKDFVMLYKQSSYAARENAVYSCQVLFRERWGQRLALLLPVLHAIRSDIPAAYNGFDDDLQMP